MLIFTYVDPVVADSAFCIIPFSLRTMLEDGSLRVFPGHLSGLSAKDPVHPLAALRALRPHRCRGCRRRIGVRQL